MLRVRSQLLSSYLRHGKGKRQEQSVNVGLSRLRYSNVTANVTISVTATAVNNITASATAFVTVTVDDDATGNVTDTDDCTVLLPVSSPLSSPLPLMLPLPPSLYMMMLPPC